MFFNQDHVIKFIAAYVLPFVNAKDSASKQAAFDKMYVDGITGFFDDLIYLQDETVANTFCEEVLKKDEVAYLGNIEKIYNLVASMLEIALKPGLVTDKSRKADTEKNINAALGSFYSSIESSWQGPGRCYCHYSGSDPFKRCESFLVLIITDFFHWDIEPIYGIEWKNPGYDCFAACAKCGKYFYKTRKSQEYCSRTCSVADAAQRFRNKKK